MPRVGTRRAMLGGGESRYLPAKLILAPATTFEEMDATTGWGLGPTGTLEVNNAQYYSGTGSLKVTTTALDDTPDMYRACHHDMSAAYQNVALRFYIHSDPATTLDSMTLYLSPTADYSKFFLGSISVDSLAQNTWYTVRFLPSDFSDSGGASWADPILLMKIRTTAKTGQIAIVSFDQFQGGISCQPAVMITFDDGPTTAYTTALTYMQPRKMVGTVYSYSDGLDATQNAQLLALRAAGWACGNHGKTHTNLATLSQADAQTELSACKAALDALGLTEHSSHVAYPSGGFNATVRAAMLAENMQTGRLVTGLYSVIDYADPLYIRAVNIASTVSLATAKSYVDSILTSGNVLTLLFHGLVAAGPVGDQWTISDFAELLDYIQQKQVQTLTIGDYYQLRQGALRVNHA